MFRHTHSKVDSRYVAWTEIINGTAKLPGIPGGVQTLEQFDRVVKTAYKASLGVIP